MGEGSSWDKGLSCVKIRVKLGLVDMEVALMFKLGVREREWICVLAGYSLGLNFWCRVQLRYQ
eukprot:4807314-Amphidinium_carterae.1